MRITLINPGQLQDAGEDQFAGRMDAVFLRLTPFRRTYFGIPLALPTLAAATPARHSVRIVDEMVERIDFDEPCDVVGISAMTCKATRGYQIAAEYRKRGIPVIMGGIHASMCPDEVAAHVDCVVIGEADAIWAGILEDLEHSRLQRKYRDSGLPDVTKVTPPRHEISPYRHYFAYFLQTTRGCPRDCSFCTVSVMTGRTLRKKTPEQVIAEVSSVLEIPTRLRPMVFDAVRKTKRRLAAGTIFFVDDNFAIDRQHALAVCRALRDFQDVRQTHISWFTQTDIRVGFDEELLVAMQEAGCVNIFIGFESLSAESLRAMHKTVNAPESYLECIRNIERHGMEVTASVIVGHDSESQRSMRELTEFALDNHLLYFFPNILTPYPGTRLADDMCAEGRILSRAHELYNVRNVVFQPRGMSPTELRSGYVQLCRTVLNVDNLCRCADENMQYPKRYYLVLRWRLAAMLAFGAILLILSLRRAITARELAKLLGWLPRAILLNGSLSVMGYIANIVNFSTFARGEQRRLAGPSAR